MSWKKINPKTKCLNISNVEGQRNEEKPLERTKKDCVRGRRSSRLAYQDGTVMIAMADGCERLK